MAPISTEQFCRQMAVGLQYSLSIMAQSKRINVGDISFFWGIGGVVGVLCWAIYRLLPYALETLQHGLAWWQWLVVAIWSIFMIVSEGYDGFQKRLVPRIYSRAQSLRLKGNSIERLLAPLYCLNYFNTELRRLVIAYVALVLIITAIVVVHSLEQPWRGMIDWGVIAGLSYGVVAILVQLPSVLRGMGSQSSRSVS